MQKQEGREKGQALLAAFAENPKEKSLIEKKLQDRLYQTDCWKNSSTIGITLSSAVEWDTKSVIRRAWSEGKQVAVPKTIPSQKKMQFYYLTNFEEACPGHFGMLEPVPEKTVPVNKKDITLLLVPGLIYTKEGFRIGFGGGYYDRYLADFPNRSLALLHSSQIVPEFEVETFDRPVDYLITEKETIQTKPYTKN